MRRKFGSFSIKRIDVDDADSFSVLNYFLDEKNLYVNIFVDYLLIIFFTQKNTSTVSNRY